MPELKRFASVTVSSFITVKGPHRHRMARERMVERVATAKLPTEYGEFTVHGYRGEDRQHRGGARRAHDGDVASGEPVLVRVHDECLTGDTFHSVRCDAARQLDVALRRIGQEAAASFSICGKRAAGSGS